eukprot:TRINITY_DN50008_c0_g1_i1.p2 TRINITY_DN50008_c0_g1~~TRINITY_DN50008_c0_g1_i1.p2  ORF type:complete len:140 (-),score=43.67 TRINITY_DN50008_c0_g1_i1:146-508(-)
MPAGLKNAFALLGDSDSEGEQAEEQVVEEQYEAAPAEPEVEFKGKKGKKKGGKEVAAPAEAAVVTHAAPTPAAAPAPEKSPEPVRPKQEKGDAKKKAPAVAAKNKFSALMGSDDEESDEE